MPFECVLFNIVNEPYTPLIICSSSPRIPDSLILSIEIEQPSFK